MVKDDRVLFHYLRLRQLLDQITIYESADTLPTECHYFLYGRHGLISFNAFILNGMTKSLILLSDSLVSNEMKSSRSFQFLYGGFD